MRSAWSLQLRPLECQWHHHVGHNARVVVFDEMRGEPKRQSFAAQRELMLVASHFRKRTFMHDDSALADCLFQMYERIPAVMKAFEILIELSDLREFIVFQ